MYLDRTVMVVLVPCFQPHRLRERWRGVVGGPDSKAGILSPRVEHFAEDHGERISSSRMPHLASRRIHKDYFSEL